MRTATHGSAMALVAALALSGVGCEDRKKAPGATSGAMQPARPRPAMRPPPRPLDAVAGIRADLQRGGDDDRRYKALDRLVRGWPRTKAALSQALLLLRTDGSIRGGVALSLARLGKPLVPPLLAMVAAAPKDKATLLAAGVLAYQLVSPQGLSRRSAAEREAIRTALKPLQKPFWDAFLADTRPEYEIYQGLAVGGAETVKRFRPPFVKGGLTRVAMVLYLVLTSKKDEVFLPTAERNRLREQAAPLAAYFARALGNARGDGKGESPDSLVLGLAVLTTSGAAAVAQDKSLRDAKQCPRVVKALLNVAEQGGPSAVMPARSALQRCINLLPDPGLTQLAKGLLAKLK